MTRSVAAAAIVGLLAQLQSSSAESAGQLHQMVAPTALTCSACLWTARAVRNVLVEKMPKRVKSAKRRRALAEEAIAAQQSDAICGARRFPKDLVLYKNPESADSKELYHDVEEIRGGKDTPIQSFHFEILSTKMASKQAVAGTCDSLLRIFASAIAARAEAHGGPRVYGAVTDRWLCVRQAQLCASDEVPAGGDDEEEDEEEL
ncbi:unnamed protein product [Polarella glacialis]|uniref:Uncharacterized protein n=1 Tax=Polarella glacialis TaxID=89957 RepID=A0A813H896_POLGL|nr:unnamed protein product [Polarella glacialis]